MITEAVLDLSGRLARGRKQTNVLRNGGILSRFNCSEIFVTTSLPVDRVYMSISPETGFNRKTVTRIQGVEFYD